MIKKIKTYILLTLLLLCQSIMAQNKTSTNDSPSQADLGIFALPPFERAVRCIKYYEGIHKKKDYPYVGYGHKLRAGERYSSNMSLREADALLRKDLTELCTMFQRYGKDSLLLAALAYNVGPYRILGSKTRYPKSTLLKKIESGNRDFKADYIQFCHWKGKKIPSIERRRYMEFILLYVP